MMSASMEKDVFCKEGISNIIRHVLLLFLPCMCRSEGFRIGYIFLHPLEVFGSLLSKKMLHSRNMICHSNHMLENKYFVFVV